MHTITIDPAPPLARPVRRHRPVAHHSGRQRVPASTYRRRRAVVGIVSAVVVACGLVLTHDVLTGSGGVPASAAESRSAPVRRTVTAQPGDSLWSIASEHHGDVAMSRYVDALVELNGAPSIRVGQQVLLP